jgi:hypothetical protein
MRLGHRAEAGSFLQAVAKLIDAQDRNRAMQHAMTVRAHDSEIIEAGFPLLSFHEGRYVMALNEAVPDDSVSMPEVESADFALEASCRVDDPLDFEPPENGTPLAKTVARVCDSTLLSSSAVCVDKEPIELDVESGWVIA